MSPSSSAPAPPHRARKRWLLAVVAIAILAVSTVAGLRPWATQPVAEMATGPDAAPVVSAPVPLVLPDQARVLIFGDSWTYGSAASDPSLGYASVLGRNMGWRATVDGVRGSGYLKAGLDGGTFGERIAALDAALDPDLVIVQGSINDRSLPATGYREAVGAAWDALASLYPSASIVVVGPAPQVLPVEVATARIDADLAALAASRGWWYISPLADEWITDENYLAVIDTGIGHNHPSTDGHAYLATRLAEAIARMSEGTDVVAEAPHESEHPDP